MLYGWHSEAKQVSTQGCVAGKTIRVVGYDTCMYGYSRNPYLATVYDQGLLRHSRNASGSLNSMIGGKCLELGSQFQLICQWSLSS